MDLKCQSCILKMLGRYSTILDESVCPVVLFTPFNIERRGKLMADIMVGIWNRITIYCTNHDEPVPMSIISNTEKIKTPFYACKYYMGDNEHPRCANRLNLDDYQGIVLKFCDIVSQYGPSTDFNNFRYDYKGTRQKISVRVLKYTNEEIRLGIKNRTVLG